MARSMAAHWNGKWVLDSGWHHEEELLLDISSYSRQQQTEWERLSADSCSVIFLSVSSDNQLLYSHDSWSFFAQARVPHPSGRGPGD